MLPPDELKELGDDIRKNGIVAPIIVWTDDSKQNFLLDGRNRLDAAEAAGMLRLEFPEGDNCPNITVSADGVFYPVRVERVISDPSDLAASFNIHRRHLTAEQKHQLTAKVIKIDPAKSDRQIAKIVRTSPTTVGKIRTGLVATGDVCRLDTRTDTKGRKQPAKKSRSSPTKIATPPTPAQRVEQKIRRAGLADEKAHGTVSADRVIAKAVQDADRDELIAMANHRAPERHLPARERCEREGVDWKPSPAPARAPADQRTGDFWALVTTLHVNGEWAGQIDVPVLDDDAAREAVVDIDRAIEGLTILKHKVQGQHAASIAVQ